MTVATLPRLSEPYAVPSADVESYRRDGHVLLRAVASTAEVAAYRDVIRSTTLRLSEETRPLAERDTYGKAFLQVPNLWQHSAEVAQFVLADRYAGIAADLLGVDRVRIYHDQALFKEPGGGYTPWHQDAMYWPLDGRRCLTMWMPLVDITPDMGGLCFASRTNAAGALSDVHISDASEEHFETVLSAAGSTGARFPVVEPVPMRAGDATFHAGWTVHKALPNDSSTAREVMTVIWFEDGLRVLDPTNPAQWSDLATWLPGLAPDEPAASALNPTVPR
jgi:ectoine hydroxylase-related dioxygenase (phytanoyl-CoA dioxygenase family)